MSVNPYEILDKADDNFEVDEATTMIIGDFTNADFVWKKDKCNYSALSLGEIYRQALAKSKGNRFFLRVWYESGMWGIIFEIGNYEEQGSQWLVHGITKGYA